MGLKITKTFEDSFGSIKVTHNLSDNIVSINGNTWFGENTMLRLNLQEADRLIRILQDLQQTRRENP